jgi:CheY-like chemotaxis protein
MAGFEVTVAEDGDQALRHLAQQIPDLVLCDILMPNLDGYETLAAIRSNPFTADVPVVMVSALSESKAVQRAMAAGANGYFVKPFETRALIQDIKSRMLAREPVS